MLNKLLYVYECKILKEHKKDKMTYLGWGYILLTIICAALCLFFEIKEHYAAFFISLGIIVVLSIFLAVFDYRNMKYDTEDLAVYKSQNIDKFANILLEAGINNLDTLDVIIAQCKEFEQEKNGILWGEGFKSLFTMLIYPILTVAATIVVKNMSDENMFTLSVLMIGAILIIFVIVSQIYPMVKNYFNKSKRIAETMRHDLEYIRSMGILDDNGKSI